MLRQTINKLALLMPFSVLGVFMISTASQGAVQIGAQRAPGFSAPVGPSVSELDGSQGGQEQYGEGRGQGPQLPPVQEPGKKKLSFGEKVGVGEFDPNQPGVISQGGERALRADRSEDPNFKWGMEGTATPKDKPALAQLQAQRRAEKAEDTKSLLSQVEGRLNQYARAFGVAASNPEKAQIAKEFMGYFNSMADRGAKNNAQKTSVGHIMSLAEAIGALGKAPYGFKVVALGGIDKFDYYFAQPDGGKGELFKSYDAEAATQVNASRKAENEVLARQYNERDRNQPQLTVDQDGKNALERFKGRLKYTMNQPVSNKDQMNAVATSLLGFINNARKDPYFSLVLPELTPVDTKNIVSFAKANGFSLECREISAGAPRKKFSVPKITLVFVRQMEGYPPEEVPLVNAAGQLNPVVKSPIQSGVKGSDTTLGNRGGRLFSKLRGLRPEIH